MDTNEFVKCEECGNHFKNISWKHLISHNMTTAEYKEKYPNAETVSHNYRLKLQENSKIQNESKKGVPRSEETKRKISEHNKGQISPNKGKKMNEEQLIRHREVIKRREENRLASGKPHHAKGKVVSEETREKLRQANLGKSLTQETIDKMIATRKRNGKKIIRGPISDEMKQKLTEYGISQRENRNEKLIEKFSVKANEAELEILNYWNAKYNKLRGTLKCKKCEYEFDRNFNCFNPSKFTVELCPLCYPPPSLISYAEKEIVELIKTFYNGTVIENNRAILGNKKEIDIYLPDLNLAIEYCGVFWHSEKMGKTQNYHFDKYYNCKNKNIDLMTIFESDWKHKRNIVISLIKNKFKVYENIVDINNCFINKIDDKQAEIFLNENDINGYKNAQLHYGIFYNQELISVISLVNNSNWDVISHCNKLNTFVEFSLDLLILKFIEDYNPIKIFAYSDLKFPENKFENFKFVDYIQPDYFYVQNNKMIGTNKNIIEKLFLEEQEKWMKVYDCGSVKYEWIKGE
jgi:hypothetical protein